jgi:hypothetical protein
MAGCLLLAALLASSSPARDAARAELETVACRIEQLKARHAAGDASVAPELHRLLVRAQELAHVIDRIDDAGRPAGHPPARNAAPTPEELRERADAARDEADRIRSALQKVEARLAELHGGSRLPQANLANARAAPGPAPDPAHGIEMLELQRVRLERTLADTLAKADRLEAEARLLDSMR